MYFIMYTMQGIRSGGGLYSLRNVKVCTATVQETVFPRVLGRQGGGGGGGGGGTVFVLIVYLMTPARPCT